MCHVSSGTMQGSCPIPILFNIFINPLLKELKRVASAYAAKIKCADNAINSTREQIQQDVNIIGDRSNAMLMLLSIVLHYGIKNLSGLI